MLIEPEGFADIPKGAVAESREESSFSAFFDVPENTISARQFFTRRYVRNFFLDCIQRFLLIHINFV